MRLRLGLVSAFLVLLTVVRFAFGTQGHSLHVIHVVFRTLFLIPILSAAVWFGFRGGVTMSVIASLVYFAHMRLSWAGQPMENINQLAIIAVYLVVGSFSGLLVKLQERERQRRISSEQNAQREAIIQGLASLCSALALRDRYTHQHSEHVAWVAAEVGRRRGFSAERVNLLRLAALVHDIGKIGIQDDILYKPDQLTSEERSRMELHPAFAAAILKPIRGAERIAEIVHAHHECPDGSGYPLGLTRECIPEEARVLSVTDVYSALTEGRPYKSAMTEQEAIRIIRAMAGQKLDEKAVESLIEWIDDKNKQRLPKPQFQFGGPPDPGNGREMALLGGRTGPWANVPEFLRRNAGPRASN